MGNVVRKPRAARRDDVEADAAVKAIASEQTDSGSGLWRRLSLNSAKQKFSSSSSSSIGNCEPPFETHCDNPDPAEGNANEDKGCVNQHTISSSLLDSRYSLSTSRSFLNFSKSRKNSSINLSKSVHDLVAARSKTYWPVPYIESSFLPHFPLLGRTFRNRYTTQALIERGAFGVVYHVTDDANNNRSFALKILNKSQIVRTASLDQVKNEVDIQTICGHHPFIVECVAYWQTHRKICILTEYIAGGELFNRIIKFTHKLVQLYVLEIAIAIDFLHNAGIIYRDLKPENILLDHDNHVKLVDFGLSKWLKIGQRTRTFCGTIQYMAPELLAGEPYGHAVDWWALGTVACRMLTNKYPRLLRVPSAPDDQDITDRNESFSCVKVEQPIVLNTEANPTRPNRRSTTTASVLLPDNVPLDHPSSDLLRRLLEVNPQHRLRSLMALERIAMYKGFSFADVRQKKISATQLIWESEQPTELIESNSLDLPLIVPAYV